MRWVLTREAEDSRALAAELHLDVVPCIERSELPWPAWPKSPLVFVTSAAVARRLGRLTAPPGTRFAALSPASTAVLGQCHVTATGGAVDLARAVKAWWKEPGPLATLYPTSDLGMEQPEQDEAVRILETLGPVTRVAVYETRSPPGLADALKAFRGDGFIFFSPSAAENFARAGGVAGAAVCVGASTARAYTQAGLLPAPLLATVETVKKTLHEVMSK